MCLPFHHARPDPAKGISGQYNHRRVRPLLTFPVTCDNVKDGDRSGRIAAAPRTGKTLPGFHGSGTVAKATSFTASIATKVELLATCGRAEIRSPITSR